MAVILGEQTLPCPQSSKREYIMDRAEVETAATRTQIDVRARKYRYTLNYDFISVADYNALESKINELTELTFIWDKYTSCSDPGISVVASLSEVAPVTPGIQANEFYSKVTLVLEEVNSR